MIWKNIDKAQKEAERFLETVNALNLIHPLEKHSSANYMKETAAVKRASMDLTRALAEMRQVRYDRWK